MPWSRAFKLLFLGACAPVLGVLFCLLQIQLNPHGPASYLLVQGGMAVLFLALFAWAGWQFARREWSRWNKWLFFAVPVLCLAAERLALGRLFPVGVLLLGLNAPFFALWGPVYGLVPAFPEAVTALPTLLCFLAFWIGEWTRRKKPAVRPLPLLCAAAVCVGGPALYAVRPTAAPADGDPVCVLRIYSDPGAGGTDFGHTFLTVENLSDHTLTVGRHPVEPQTTVSVGKFRTYDTQRGGYYEGLSYNVETQRAEHLHWYAVDRSMARQLTAPELDRVNQVLLRLERGYSEVGNNCCTLAAQAWNGTLSPKDPRYVVRYGTPALVYREIGESGQAQEGNAALSADYPCRYYDGGRLRIFLDPKQAG